MLILNMYYRDQEQSLLVLSIRKEVKVVQIDLLLKYLSEQVVEPMPLFLTKEKNFHQSQILHLSKMKSLYLKHNFKNSKTSRFK